MAKKRTTDKTPKFKVGDKVRLTKDAVYAHGIPLPTNLTTNEFVVTNVYDDMKRVALSGLGGGNILFKHIKEVVNDG